MLHRQTLVGIFHRRHLLVKVIGLVALNKPSSDHAPAMSPSTRPQNLTPINSQKRDRAAGTQLVAVQPRSEA